MSRVDASRHLNILLNADIFTGQEVAENAKILLRFVRHSEKINSHANSIRMSELTSARDPRLVGGAAYQASSLSGKASHTAFGDGWGTSYDPTLPTSTHALGQVYKKMKPVRLSLQIKGGAPFGAKRRVKEDQ